MNALEVIDLKKQYPSFTLSGISFSVEEGRIVGLIGRNGAGKSTTLKGILRLISTTGEVYVFGMNMARDEIFAKESVGYVGGGFRFYPSKTLKSIKKAYCPFYKNWDDIKYNELLGLFNLDENKCVRELSEGMKVKFSLALALSHGAKLLIMDEPTSGLDPLSRDEFCDTVLSLVKNEGVSVLFSTHITSDLEKIADDIVYISSGEILLNGSLEEVLKRYKLIKFSSFEDLKGIDVIGVKEVKKGYEALVEDALYLPSSCVQTDATIEDVMVHLEIERGKREC